MTFVVLHVFYSSSLESPTNPNLYGMWSVTRTKCFEISAPQDLKDHISNFMRQQLNPASWEGNTCVIRHDMDVHTLLNAVEASGCQLCQMGATKAPNELTQHTFVFKKHP